MPGIRPMVDPGRGGEIRGVVGNMATGKTNRLIALAWERQKQQDGVLFLQPGIANRTGDNSIKSRTFATYIPTIAVATANDMRRAVTKSAARNVFIEELHFFERTPAMARDCRKFIKELRCSGRNIFWAGLPLDFRGDQFELVAMLMALSDGLEMLETDCAVCGHRPAQKPQRLEFGQPVPRRHPRFLPDTPGINVSGITYEPRCFHCHAVPDDWNDISQAIHRSQAEHFERGRASRRSRRTI